MTIQHTCRKNENEEKSPEKSQECTSRIGIDNTHEKYNEYASYDEIPVFFLSEIVSEYPHIDKEVCPHRIRSIEYSLKSPYVGSFYSMKYWYCRAKLPIRWIAWITNIEKNIFRKWPLEEHATEERYASSDEKKSQVIWESLSEKSVSMEDRKKKNEKSKIRANFIEYDEKENKNIFLRIIDISL